MIDQTIYTVKTTPEQQAWNEKTGAAYQKLFDANGDLYMIQANVAESGCDPTQCPDCMDLLRDAAAAVGRAQENLDRVVAEADEELERLEAFRAAEISAVMSGGFVPDPSEYGL